jgi:hypothetical protein
MDPLASINPYASLKEELRLRQVYQTIPAGSTRFLRYKKQISDETGAPKPLLYFELETHNIEENWPQYSALSYTWGHPLLDDFKDDFADAIICNGQRIPVGFNLHEALQYFFVHSSVAPELLWVDAICIDQSNLTERADQVQMMSQIYAHAANVIIWLGQDDQDARDSHAFLAEYIPALRKICEVSVAEDPNWALTASKYNVYDDPEFHREYGTTPKSLENWTSLVKFLSRRWFRRLWVVQEIAFSASLLICCGTLRFKWFDLDFFSLCVFGSHWYGPNLEGLQHEMDNIAQVFTLHREIRLWQIAGPNDPAFGHLGAEEKVYRFAQFLMVQTAALDATDPRDKVFALATFIKSYATYLGARADWFKPDYTVQPTEAMLVAVQLVMHKTRSVDLLSYVADPSSRAPSNLPTWFPHFHLPRAVASVDSLLRIFQGRLFHAGSLSAAVLTPSDVYIHFDTSEIEITGFVVDRIAELVRFGNDIVPFLRMCLQLPLRYKNGEPPVEVLWRTLIAGRTEYAFPAPPETATAFSKYIKAVMIGHALEALIANNKDGLSEIINILCQIDSYCPHPTLPSASEFSSAMLSVIHDPDTVLADVQRLHARNTYRTAVTPTPWGQNGKAVFLTRDRYLGLCPYSSQVGDEVWLFKGARLFYVLRGEAVGRPVRELIGESYLHGFMEGEALRTENLTWTSALIK